MAVLGDILAERRRQWDRGYDAAHDDDHDAGELANAAAFLALVLDGATPTPWAPTWAGNLKGKGTRRQQLVVAAALLVAEIERLDRVTERVGPILPSRSEVLAVVRDGEQVLSNLGSSVSLLGSSVSLPAFLDPRPVPDQGQLLDRIKALEIRVARMDSEQAQTAKLVETVRKDVFGILQRHP